jgi:hypothetical protein
MTAKLAERNKLAKRIEGSQGQSIQQKIRDGRQVGGPPKTEKAATVTLSVISAKQRLRFQKRSLTNATTIGKVSSIINKVGDQVTAKAVVGKVSKKRIPGQKSRRAIARDRRRHPRQQSRHHRGNGSQNWNGAQVDNKMPLW